MLAALVLAMALTPRVVQVKLGPVHAEILRAITRPAHRFLDVEGALRSAKTWTILIKLRRRLEEHPGMKAAIARWTEGDLNQKLIPDWRNICALMGLLARRVERPRILLRPAERLAALRVHLKTSNAITATPRSAA
jgi:hypothetical protein